jgi:hypothetical protein
MGIGARCNDNKTNPGLFLLFSKEIYRPAVLSARPVHPTDGDAFSTKRQKRSPGKLF